MRAVAAGGFTGPHAVQEMLALEAQRLRRADMRDQDISKAHVEIILVRYRLGADVDALVVNPDLVRRFHVVEHDHLPAPHHRGPPGFMGIQPTQMNVRHSLLREMQSDEDHIHDPLLEIGLPLGGHDLWFRPEQVQRHRHIVRPEAPERILIHADPAEVQPLAVEVKQIADLACGDEVLHFDDGRMIQEEMSHHQAATGAASQTDQVLGFGRLQGHRLLDQDVLSRLKGSARLPVMLRGERGDDDGIHRTILHDIVVLCRRTNAGMLRPHVFQPTLVHQSAGRTSARGSCPIPPRPRQRRGLAPVAFSS